MYKVKNFDNFNGRGIQREIKEWIESRDHVVIVSVSIWEQGSRNYATIVYQEIQYCG